MKLNYCFDSSSIRSSLIYSYIVPILLQGLLEFFDSRCKDQCNYPLSKVTVWRFSITVLSSRMFFITAFFVIVPSIFAEAPRCNSAEHAVWINNQHFADTYDNCSRAATGASEGTADGIRAIYPQISPHCLTCFGQAAACGAMNCMWYCAANSAHPDCVNCINENCIPQLQSCTGSNELPPVPSPRVRSATRGRTRNVKNSQPAESNESQSSTISGEKMRSDSSTTDAATLFVLIPVVAAVIALATGRLAGYF